MILLYSRIWYSTPEHEINSIVHVSSNAFSPLATISSFYIKNGLTNIIGIFYDAVRYHRYYTDMLYFYVALKKIAILKLGLLGVFLKFSK